MESRTEKRLAKVGKLLYDSNQPGEGRILHENAINKQMDRNNHRKEDVSSRRKVCREKPS